MAEPFRMKGSQGKLDKKNVANITLSWFAPTLEHVLIVGGTPPLGLAEVGRTFGELDAGGYQVDIEYEGLPGSGGEGPQDRGDGAVDEGTVEFDSAFSEEPLPSHPDWDVIKDLYQGTYNTDTEKVTFPEKLTNGKKSGLNASGGEIKNPLFGTKTYLTFSAIYRRTRIVEELPSNLLTDIGTIRANLPEGLPSPKEHDWLIMPPKVTKRGNVWQITEEWKMSKKGGWEKKVYNLIEV